MVAHLAWSLRPDDSEISSGRRIRITCFRLRRTIGCRRSLVTPLEVSEQIDISPIVADYDEEGRTAAVPPADDAGVALYSYMGVFLARSWLVARRTCVRVIVGEDIPDFQRISEFRRRRGFRLGWCREAGLLKVGRLALDGTKVKANASRHKAMSYDRMTSEELRLQQEIDELLAQAQAADAAAKAARRVSDELPDELARRETRYEKIRESKAALEERARQKAADHAAKLESEGRTPRNDPDDAVPKPKDQRNFTDPESKIMKTSNKASTNAATLKRLPTKTRSLSRPTSPIRPTTSSSGTDGRTDAGEPGCHREASAGRCGLLQRKARQSGSERTH